MELFLKSLWIAIIFNLIGCTTTNPAENKPDCPGLAKGTVTPCRPFRAEVIKLSEEIDEIKPLAPIDSSGWVLISDLLIGAIDNHWVAGLSLKDKKVAWWLQTPSDLVTPITSFGSWIVLGLRNGDLWKIESLSGKVIWKTNVARLVHRPLTVKGSQLYAHTATDQLFSIDFQTGKTSWIYDGGSPNTLVVSGGAAPLATTNNRVYIGTAGGEIHAVNTVDGKVVWKTNPGYSDYKFHDVIGELIQIGNNLIITRSDGVVTAIPIDNKKNNIWKESLPALTTVKSRDGVLYIGGLNGDLYAMEAGSGRRLWTTSTGQSISTITIGEKVIYISGSNGHISAVNLTNGIVLWNDDIRGSLNNTPVQIENKIFFPTGLRVFYGYLIF
ncbi:MAG: PQQ-binding-like beta-propeller repeat protein [Oligoflexales bacterium]|nr:PQQ-binding-like beta-propeller repeat protein [Oligoflexales bacterium]